ncbi:hypothetical protein OIU78_027100 [Salix suchowensis]|nr:hypothetical protein OIU78_027100 [Salix suchowensis]
MFSLSSAALLATLEQRLRAWVAGQYAHINFSDQNNFRKALHSIVSGLRDPDLPVRVDSVFALRSFVEACKDLSEIRPILPQLLDEFFKLMNEVENEDLVFTLETIVDKFGEEMAPYALGLCSNLRGFPDLFVQIEPTLLPIMRRMLTTDGQEVFEEVLEIVSSMTLFSPTISQEMWSLWPLMIEAPAEWAIDFFPSTYLVHRLLPPLVTSWQTNAVTGILYPH